MALHFLTRRCIRSQLGVFSTIEQLSKITLRWKSQHMIASNIPHRVKEHELVDFFAKSKIVGGEKGIHFLRDDRGYKSGEVIAELESEDDLENALDLNGEIVPRSDRAVHIRAIDEEYFRELKNNSRKTLYGKVFMRGLPYRATEQDVETFFFPLVPERIVMGYNTNDGFKRFAGRVDVYFSSHEDAVEAVKLDKQYIGSRYIDLFLHSVPLDD